MNKSNLELFLIVTRLTFIGTYKTSRFLLFFY